MKSRHSAARSLRTAAPRPLHTPLLLACSLACGAVQAQTERTDAPTLGEVQVQASSMADLPGLALDRPVNNGALGQRTALETPFSSANISADIIEQTAPGKLGDLFFADASVSDNSSTSGGWASYLSVRGLDMDWQNSFRIDGHPFISYATLLPYEHMEQVDLLKGATGFLYGFGSPGGLINYVTKKPTGEPVRNVGLGFSGKSLWRANADIGGRAGEDGRFGYRLNLSHESGEAANTSRQRRNAVSLALDAKLTSDLSWELQSLFQKRRVSDMEPTITTSSLAERHLPQPVANDDGRMVGPGNFSDNEFKYVSTGLKYRLAQDWQLSGSYSHSSTRTQRNESVISLLDSAGNYRNFRSDYGEAYQTNQFEALLQGRLQTGAVRHQIVAGASWQQQRNDYSAAGTYEEVGLGNLNQANRYAYYSPTGLDGLGLYRAADITQRAIFASDTLEFSQQWSVLAGIRYNSYQQRQYDTTGAETSRYEKSGTATPTLALMYRFAPQSMAYASYMEALVPGSIVADRSLSNYRALLNPLKTRQYEMGVKTVQPNWSATAALFRIEKPSEYSDGTTMRQDGQSTYQGLELAGAVKLARQWSLGGNLMLLDSEYGRGNAAIDGNRIAGAPRYVATAQLGYHVPQLPGLQLTAGIKHTGNTMLDAANQLQVAGYSLLNLGANYETVIAGKSTTLRVMLSNATNRKYWAYQYANYIKAGDPRSINLSATVRF